MCVSKSTQKRLFLGVCKNKYPNPVVFWENLGKQESSVYAGSQTF